MKRSPRSRKSSWLIDWLNCSNTSSFTRLYLFFHSSIFLFCLMRHRPSTTISESEPMLALTPESTSQQHYYSFDRVFLRRLVRIFHILFPSSPHEQIWSFSPKIRQRSLFWLYITYVALSCGCEILYYYTGLLPSRFYAVLSSSDLQGFIRFILPCLLLVFGTAAVCILTFLSFVSNWYHIIGKELIDIYGRIVLIENTTAIDTTPAWSLYSTQHFVFSCHDTQCSW